MKQGNFIYNMTFVVNELLNITKEQKIKNYITNILFLLTYSVDKTHG